ncbi:MAG: polyphosphate kinase 2 [Campylobacterales bacterium]|nr:polyphosphate kinase 2 [Campylobacterales bacterium]
MKVKQYKKNLYDLQVELVKFQKHVIEKRLKVCIIIEGRDAAGKDGTIKRFVEHLSPREARVVALGKPSDRENGLWYFQRYVAHLPAEAEIVFFNRSWYNRAGVERVMKFCTQKEYKIFMDEVGNFEHLLTHSGMLFFKYYLDITKKEQKRRLEDRKHDPLTQWKLSPIDMQAQERWDDYSKARDDMFAKTSFDFAPWYIVHDDTKKSARIHIIRHFLSEVDYPGKDHSLFERITNGVFIYSEHCHRQGLIAP